MAYTSSGPRGRDNGLLCYIVPTMSASLVDIIKTAQASTLIDEDEEVIDLELLPPLTQDEISAFAESLPCTLPDQVRELLAYTCGFGGVVADYVDFTGGTAPFGYDDAFPHGLPIAADGFGNYWVVDLTPDATNYGPIYFACHDAPVILYQSAGLAEFLTELFRACQPPHASLIHDVHGDVLHDVYRENPGVLSHADALASADAVIQGFARMLDASWSIIDLRHATPGMGFSWGRYGPNTKIKRHGTLPIFAYAKPKGFFRRLFGK